MGFYSPQTLVADARRHGVEVRHADLHASDAHPVLEAVTGEQSDARPSGDPGCLAERQALPGPFDPDAPPEDARHRRDTPFAVRLGLAGVKSIGADLAKRIVAEREAHGRFADQADLVRRVGLSAVQMEALSTAGAFGCFGLTRRQALWIAGSAAQERPDHLTAAAQPPAPPPQPQPPHSAPTGQGTPTPPAHPIPEQVPLLPDMNPAEQVMADLWATGISPDDYPTRHVRDKLDELGVVSAERLRTYDNGRRILVGGVVTHRQRPATAGGVTFLNLEDETGMINIICPQTVWDRHRRIARESPALLIRGRLERAQGVTNIVAEKLARLPLTVRTMSRDFH